MAGNKRSNTAMVTALILGVHCCLPGMVAKAEGKSADAVKVQTSGDVRESILQGNLGFEDFTEGILGNQELLLKYTESFGENTKAEDKGLPGNDDSGLSAGKEQPEDVGEELQKEKKSLQMPQKLEVVIDPWEIDGKGQIYSDEYVIQNTGEDTGILTLSNLTCIPREKSGAVIRTDRNGIHEDKRKSIYIELLFSTGERIILSEEGGRYEAELKPGEEVSLQFAGEVNEYADGNWDNEDIAVGVVYSWERKKDTADIKEEVGEGYLSGDIPGGIVGEKSGDVPEDKLGGELEASGDAAGGSFLEDSLDIGTGTPYGDNHTEEDDRWKEERRTIDLENSGEAEIEADSWTVAADGKNASMWYVLRNTGKTPGILILSEPECMGAGQDEFAVSMIPDSEESCQDRKLQAAGEENRVTAAYPVELKPGEEITICFSVKLDGLTPDELKGGKAAIKVRYSWILDGETECP